MRRPYALLPLALLLSTTDTAGIPQDTRRREALVAARVDARALRDHVKALVALGPRMGGTPSGDRASRHVSRAFAHVGLDTVEVDDPPKLAHWEDDWFVGVVPDGPAFTSAYPYGFSPPVTRNSGRLMAGGDLSSINEQWSGAVVWTRSFNRAAYERLRASKVRPLAVLAAPRDAKPVADAARLGELPAQVDNPTAVFAISYNDGARLDTARASVGVSLSARTETRRPKTVIGTLAGASDRYFLISAHGDSDSGGPGADDNASGVATVLEIARVLTTLVRAKQLPPPRTALRFVVWGSEYHSARAYIEREGDRLARCAGVINLDETGTGAEREAIYAESNDVPWNASLLRAFEGVGKDYLGRDGFWPEFTTNPSQGGTDSYAFLPKVYKGGGYTSLRIPSTTVYTAAWDKLATLNQTPGWATLQRGVPPGKVVIDYSRYYHSGGDTPENTTEREPQNMVRAARLTALALLRLAWQP